MNSNLQVLEKFYSSFKSLDGQGMSECYHESVQFSDPVFPDLKGAMASSMWKMLCSEARDFELTFHSLQADEKKGQAHWEAKYCFSKTGRSVHNKVFAVFEFQDGKIIRHRDHFSFWKWSSMALGPVGLVLGWSPLIKNEVKKQANKGLMRFTNKTN